MKELHVANVVEVYLVLEDDRQSLPVQSDGENGGGKGKLADSRLSLFGCRQSSVSCMVLKPLGSLCILLNALATLSLCRQQRRTYFGVGYLQPSW